MKKLIGIILSVLLILQICNVVIVNAQTENFPQTLKIDNEPIAEGIPLYDYVDLLEVANQINNGNKEYACATFVLAGDIIIEEEWEPIGTVENPFSGVFNGNGKKIKGMSIEADNIYSGLFGVSNGIIQNLYLEDYIINNTTQYCGSLVGYNGGIIVNCQTKGTITAFNQDQEIIVGGIAGVNNGEIGFSSTDAQLNSGYQIKVERNNTDGFYTNPDTYAGGLVGSNIGTISSCFSRNSVNIISDDSNGVYGGGIAAYNSGTVKESYSIGNVLGGHYYESYVAGVVAKNDSSGQVISCFSGGTIGVSGGDSFSSHISGSIVAENKGLVLKCHRYKNQNVSVPKYAFWDCGTINKTGTEIDNIAKFYTPYFLESEMSWEISNWKERAGDYPVLFDIPSAIIRYTIERIHGTGSIILEYNSLKNLKPDLNSYIEENKNLIINLDGYYPIDITECSLTNRNQLALVPQSTDSYICAVHCDGKDALANEVYLNKESNKPVKIFAYQISDEFNVGFQIIAKNKKSNVYTVVSDSRYEELSIIPSMFNSNDEFYICIVLPDGKTINKLKLGIQVVNYVNVDDIEGMLNFGDKALGFTVPKGIPAIGGKEINIITEDLPFGLVKTDDRIQIYIGISDLKEGTFPDFKEGIDALNKNFRNYSNYLKNQKNDVLNLSSKTPKPNLDFDVRGYVDIPLDNNGDMQLNHITSKLVLVLEGEWETQKQYYVSVLPIVVKFKIEADVSAELIMEFDNNLGVEFLGAFEINAPTLTPSIGVGFTAGLDVSIYGKIAHELRVDMSKKGVRSKLVGELGLSATALNFSAEESIIDGEILIYDSITQSSPKKLLRSAARSYISNVENYTIDRSYLENQSQFLGNTRTYSLKNSNFTFDEKILQNSVYHSAAPKTVELNNGTIFMIWTTDIEERSDYNHTAAVYSIYNPSTDTWTDPQIIDDDNTADFNPTIATDGENIWVSWVNSNQAFASEISLSDMAKSTEIAVADFDFENNSFKNKVILTNDSYYDTGVEIFVNNGTAYVSWIKNLNNDVLNLSGCNEVYYANTEDLTKVIKVLNLNDNIYQPKLGLLGEETVLTYIKDADADLTTIDDSQLYIKNIMGDNNETLYDDGTISSVCFANLNGENVILYCNDSYIFSINDSNLPASEILKLAEADSFDVLKSDNELAITYIAPNLYEEGKNAVYIIRYNGSEWSSPIVLAETDGYIKNVSGHFNEDGNYRIYYSKTQVEFSESGMTKNTALCTAVTVPYYDVSIDNISYNPFGYSTDEALPVELDITNKGFYDITSFDIDITDEQENIIYQQTIEYSLKSGDNGKLSCNITLPSSIRSATNYVITLSPSGFVDAIGENNVSTITVGYSNILIDVKRISSGNAVGAMLSVTNKSCKEESIILYVRKNNYQGEILTKISLGTVRPGETVKYIMEPNRFRAFDENITAFCFEVTCKEKLLLDNNTAIMIYHCPQLFSMTDKTVAYYYDVNTDESFDIRDLVAIDEDINQDKNDLFRLDIDGDCKTNSSDIINVKNKLLYN